MTQAITSLSQFLNHIGVNVRFYDLGRRISKLNPETISAVEEGRTPYPTPYLHQAWLALVLANPEEPKSPTIWFLRFPLDEQGKLILPERDRFLQTLLSAVGGNLEAANSGQRLNAVLENNPFVFTPPPERQAAFHARIKANLQLPPSQFFDTARYYLETGVHTPEEEELWQAVGLQGLADIAVRWQKKDVHTPLIKALPVLPLTPFACLCECLENEPVDAKVARAICARLEKLSKLDTASVDAQTLNRATAAALRGLSNSVATGMRRQAITGILASDAATIPDVIVALSTRCGDDLITPGLTLPFLEALAAFPQETFNRVMADLLFQPHLRQTFLDAFRQPQRSETLATAIGGLLSQ